MESLATMMALYLLQRVSMMFSLRKVIKEYGLSWRGIILQSLELANKERVRKTMEKEGVRVIVPKGAFGASRFDNSLEEALRFLAQYISPDPDGEWADKYGTSFENDIFMMYPFCWCDKDDCPWCAGCTCPSEAFHYFVDGKEVSFDEWMDFFKREVDGKVSTLDHSEWMKLADEVNRRRTESHDVACDFCKTGGVATSKGGEAGRTAPNFWYKPADFKVWWYKYIGRDTETNRDISRKKLNEIFGECLDSFGKGEAE